MGGIGFGSYYGEYKFGIVGWYFYSNRFVLICRVWFFLLLAEVFECVIVGVVICF